MCNYLLEGVENVLGAKLTQQINVRLSPDLYEGLEEYARKDWRSMGELGRILLEWAVPLLRKAGSMQALSGWQAAPKRESIGRVSPETHEQLHLALDAILNSAPSTVIERVSEYLIERAVKYGYQPLNT
jgi:hypothetical protein